VVVACVTSIIEKSTFRDFEIVVVHDAGAEPAVLTALKKIAGTSLRLVRFDGPFNFSRKMNLGVVQARGNFILSMNDDVEVISADWLEQLRETIEPADVAMVGAMLYFANDTIQHAGHAHRGGLPTHVGIGEPRGSSGPDGDYLDVRERVGVTAACALIRRDAFEDVGGFCELLPGNYNDVDLSLKLRSRGYRILWTPRAELYHFESVSRSPEISGYEIDFLHNRWGSHLTLVDVSNAVVESRG
jgi:GT2 family glycosyltransferase